MNPNTKIARSPSGSLFPYYYKNNEIHCLKYGSFFNNQELLFERINEEEEFFILANRQLNTWIDLYETKITSRVINKLIYNINTISHLVNKLALVGNIAFWNKMIIIMGLNRINKSIKTEIRFFEDPEIAKTWLVS